MTGNPASFHVTSNDLNLGLSDSSQTLLISPYAFASNIITLFSDGLI